MNRICLLFVVAAVGLAGCGGSDLPELGTVSGVVKSEGKPLPNAIVNFTPKGHQGRPSSGETDDSGNYTLLYLVDTEGAIVGEHTVTVEKIISEDEDNMSDDPADLEPGQELPKPLPASASDGSITKEVKAGDNEINIDLT